MQQQRKLWGKGSEETTTVADQKGWATLQGLSHFELGGKTIGLIGGRGLIGSKVSEMARVFGMKVRMLSLPQCSTGHGAHGHESVEKKQEMQLIDPLTGYIITWRFFCFAFHRFSFQVGAINLVKEQPL